MDLGNAFGKGTASTVPIDVENDAGFGGRLMISRRLFMPCL